MKLLAGIIAVLKNAKWTRRRQPVCPRCGSSEIVSISPLAGWLTPMEYACLKCGYRSAIIMEVDKTEQEKVEADDSRAET